jgi:hypothetical protein
MLDFRLLLPELVNKEEDLIKICCEHGTWTELAQDRVRWSTFKKVGCGDGRWMELAQDPFYLWALFLTELNF